MNLPAGTLVSKVVSSEYTATDMVLTTTGQIYAWGLSGFSAGNGVPNLFNTSATSVVSSVSSQYNLLLTPALVGLPVGETSFTDVAYSYYYKSSTMSFYIGGSGRSYVWGYDPSDGMIRYSSSYGGAAAANTPAIYHQVDAMNGITANHVEYHANNSFWWNSSNGIMYVFGDGKSNAGSGYQGTIFPARQLLSGFVDIIYSATPGTNSITTGSNPYPGPGY